MTGIFDSGVGGLAALWELRRLSPSEDIIFLADVKNAPYGTRSPEEIVSFATENIRRLMDLGADRVLIACCTASAFHKLLPNDERRISFPIIEPSARLAARMTKNGKIAVISTALTASSGAFPSAITAESIDAEVIVTPAGELVDIAERTVGGGELTPNDKKTVARLLQPALDFGADTLVLGCTHFSHLECEIKEFAKNVSTVDCAKVGARVVASLCGEESGRTVFL